jgi:hypothetical protein
MLVKRIERQDRYPTAPVVNARSYCQCRNVLMEYDDSQTPVLQRYYVHGTGYVDERAVMHDAASEADYYYTLKDLYSVDALINNRGHEVERVTYDAYGLPLMKSIHVADVDYSGTVNATDTAAVVANYGLSVGTVGLAAPAPASTGRAVSPGASGTAQAPRRRAGARATGQLDSP